MYAVATWPAAQVRCDLAISSSRIEVSVEFPTPERLKFRPDEDVWGRGELRFNGAEVDRTIEATYPAVRRVLLTADFNSVSFEAEGGARVIPMRWLGSGVAIGKAWNITLKSRDVALASPVGSILPGEALNAIVAGLPPGYLVASHIGELRQGSPTGHAVVACSASFTSTTRSQADSTYVAKGGFTDLELPWKGPVVAPEIPWTSQQALDLGRRVFWSSNADRLEPIATSRAWVAHGLATMFALRFVQEASKLGYLNRRFEPATWFSQARRYFEGLSPHAYSLAAGPPSHVRSDKRTGYRDFVAPLKLLHELGFRNVFPDAQSISRWIEDVVSPDGTELKAVDQAAAGSFVDLDLWGRKPPSYKSLKAIPKLPPENTWVMLISGDTAGFLESCGCAINQSGGAAKRVGLLRALRKKHDHPVVAVDLGHRFQPPEGLGKLAASEAEVIRDIFGSYDILVPSLRDLSVPERIEAEKSHAGWTTSNVPELRETHPDVRVLDIAGTKVAIVGVTLPKDSAVSRTRRRYRAVLGKLDLERAVVSVGRALMSVDYDVCILAGCFTASDCVELIDKFPHLDLVVSSSSATWSVEAIESATRVKVQTDLYSRRYKNTPIVVHEGLQGYAVQILRLGWTEGEGLKVIGLRTQYLDDSVEEDAIMRARIARHYRDSAGSAEWRLSPLHPGNEGPGYVGSESCKQCHASEYRAWFVSQHGQAYNTLLKRRRHYVPSCVQCHVVGMGEPTGFKPKWKSRSSHEHLTGVGCETCHGGGKSHVSRPSRSNIRRHMSAQECVKCHDSEHSPEFRYRDYMRRIKHW